MKQHAEKMKGMDIKQVFGYVVTHHPKMGMAMSLKDAAVISKHMPTMDNKTLSTLADAVTVARCNEQTEWVTKMGVSDLINGNETSVGNLAYVSIHHHDPAIKARAESLLDQWRRRRNGSCTIC